MSPIEKKTGIPSESPARVGQTRIAYFARSPTVRNPLRAWARPSPRPVLGRSVPGIPCARGPDVLNVFWFISPNRNPLRAWARRDIYNHRRRLGTGIPCARGPDACRSSQLIFVQRNPLRAWARRPGHRQPLQHCPESPARVGQTQRCRGMTGHRPGIPCARGPDPSGFSIALQRVTEHRKCHQHDGHRARLLSDLASHGFAVQ